MPAAELGRGASIVLRCAVRGRHSVHVLCVEVQSKILSSCIWRCGRVAKRCTQHGCAAAEWRCGGLRAGLRPCSRGAFRARRSTALPRAPYGGGLVATTPAASRPRPRSCSPGPYRIWVVTRCLRPLRRALEPPTLSDKARASLAGASVARRRSASGSSRLAARRAPGAHDRAPPVRTQLFWAATPRRHCTSNIGACAPGLAGDGTWC